jgi:hypothetical protein
VIARLRALLRPRGSERSGDDRTAPSATTPVAVHDAPRGWKCATPVWRADEDGGGDVALLGVSMGGAYGAEEGARCSRSGGHAAPAWDCTCGFHAFADRADAVRLLGRSVAFDATAVVGGLCEVDLHGRVVRHDRGFRAQHQRVLSLRLLRPCADCAAVGRVTDATGLGGGTPRPRITSSIDATADGSQRLLRPRARVRDVVPLRPLCASCGAAATAATGIPHLTRAELAASLGTEVGWLAADVVPAQRVVVGHLVAGY